MDGLTSGGRGHGGRQLGDGGADEPVEDGDGDAVAVTLAMMNAWCCAIGRECTIHR